MDKFNFNNYLKRMANLIVSPDTTLRAAIEEEAKFDAVASLVLSNILNAMITASWVIYLNFKQSLVHFSLFKMVFKSVVSTNVMFVLCVAGYYFVGRALGGGGTPLSIFISFGLVSVITAAVSTVGNFASWLVFPATIINIVIGFIACREAHRFDDPKQVVITAVVASIAVSAANYIISFVI